MSAIPTEVQSLCLCTQQLSSKISQKIGQHLRSKASAALELSKVRQTAQRLTKRCVLTLRHIKTTLRRFVTLIREVAAVRYLSNFTGRVT